MATALICPIMRVMLFVKDVPLVARFYQAVLGLKLIGEVDPKWVELDAESCTIALLRPSCHYPSGANLRQKLYLVCVMFLP